MIGQGGWRGGTEDVYFLSTKVWNTGWYMELYAWCVGLNLLNI
jgi:hypothetical protein